MSTRSLSNKQIELPTTPEHLRPVQQLILRWGWKVTNRRDVIPTIIPKRLRINIGAPARFVPATAQIHVPEEAFKDVDVSKVRSINEFIADHLDLAGKFVHEFGHARCSPDLAFLERFRKNHSAEMYDALVLLLEGHCESQLWPFLNGLEQEALQSVVLHEVLKEIKPADPDAETDYKSARVAVQLMGLIAARVDNDIIDVSLPTANTLYVSMVAALGERFEGFWDIATKFAGIEWSYWSDCEKRMTDLTREWVDLTNSFVKETEERQEQERQEQEQEEQEEQEQEGPTEPSTSGSEPSKEEGEEPSGESGEEGESTGTPQEGEGETQQPRALSKEDKNKGAGLGSYQSGDSGLDSAALEEAIEALEDAAKDQEQVSGAAAKQFVKVAHEASAEWDHKRKQWNKDLGRQWR